MKHWILFGTGSIVATVPVPVRTRTDTTCRRGEGCQSLGSGAAPLAKYMKSVTTDRARIIAPPPVIYLGMLSLGLFGEWIWPTRLLSCFLAVASGSAIFTCGAIGLTATIRTLLRAHTPVDPYKGTTALVTDGPFQFSRNPIYVSDLFLYVGLSLTLNAWWVLAMTPALAWIMNIGVIKREEAYLEHKFGDDYLRYKQRVRRWL